MATSEGTTEDSGRGADGRCLFLTFSVAIVVVLAATPIAVAFGASPRRSSQVAFQLACLFGLFLFARGTFAERRRTIGLFGEGSAWKRWIAGFIVGAGGLFCLTSVLWAFGERTGKNPEEPIRTALECVKYIPLALLLGVIEDVLFFGVFYNAIGKRLFPAMFVYAWSHFIHIDRDAVFSFPDWLIGAEAFIHMGKSLLAARFQLGELFGLFIVGGVLGCLRRESRTLWFGMGLHGGWYFARTAGRKFSKDIAGSNDHWLGTDLFYDGLAGWALLFLTGVLTVAYFRRRAALSAR